MQTYNKKQGFTLAELMIVLTVIGVLTAILIPVAIHSLPDKNVAKFKKANSVLYRVINELVNSDNYYLEGDLGIYPDGVDHYIDSSETNTEKKVKNIEYFCKMFSDIITTKNVGCASVNITTGYVVIKKNDTSTPEEVTETSLTTAKNHLDEYCKNAQKTVKKEIVSSDDIVFYQTNPLDTFGNSSHAIYGTVDQTIAPSRPDNFGIDTRYHVFCMDIDGFDNNKTCDNTTDICPFGYGIRVDGKILPGTLAETWLQKTITEKD